MTLNIQYIHGYQVIILILKWHKHASTDWIYIVNWEVCALNYSCEISFKLNVKALSTDESLKCKEVSDSQAHLRGHIMT